MDAINRDFLQAIAPDTTWCLGLRLHPFSLGDKLILSRLESPFLSYSHGIDYNHLREAALVCACPYEEALIKISSPTLPLQIRLWHWRLTWCGLRSVNFRRAVSVMWEHIEKGLNRPALIPTGQIQDGAPMSSPRDAVLITHLMERGQSLSQILNQPLSLSEWLYGTFAEKTGGARISTADELAELQAGADAAQAKQDAQRTA